MESGFFLDDSYNDADKGKPKKYLFLFWISNGFRESLEIELPFIKIWLDLRINFPFSIFLETTHDSVKEIKNINNSIFANLYFTNKIL